MNRMRHISRPLSVRQWVIVVLLAGSRIAPAQSAADPRTAMPERPTVATHAGTVAPRVLEIESGVELDHVPNADQSVLTPTVFKFGIAPRVQLGVFGTVTRASGQPASLGDIGAGIKWRLAEDVPLLGDFAVLPAVKLPTGSVAKESGTGTTDVSLLLISSHELGPVAMDLNAGYTHRSGDGTIAPRNATLWTVSFGGPITGAAGWVAEVFGYPETLGPAGQSSTVALLAGPTLTVRRWLVFDTGVITPISGPQAHAWYAGVVYNVGRW